MGENEMEGYLSLKTVRRFTGLTQYKKVWLQLKPEQLTWYQNSSSKTPLGSIAVNQIKGAVHKSFYKDGTRFDVIGLDRVACSFRAESFTVAHVWASHIQMLSTRAGGASYLTTPSASDGEADEGDQVDQSVPADKLTPRRRTKYSRPVVRVHLTSLQKLMYARITKAGVDSDTNVKHKSGHNGGTALSSTVLNRHFTSDAAVLGFLLKQMNLYLLHKVEQAAVAERRANVGPQPAAEAFNAGLPEPQSSAESSRVNSPSLNPVHSPSSFSDASFSILGELGSPPSHSPAAVGSFGHLSPDLSPARRRRSCLVADCTQSALATRAGARYCAIHQNLAEGDSRCGTGKRGSSPSPSTGADGGFSGDSGVGMLLSAADDATIHALCDVLDKTTRTKRAELAKGLCLRVLWVVLPSYARAQSSGGGGNDSSMENIDPRLVSHAITSGKRSNGRNAHGNDSIARIAGDPQRVLKEGWLSKQGTVRRTNWKRRYFILRSTTLEYYKFPPTEPSHAPSGSIPLSGVFFVELDKATSVVHRNAEGRAVESFRFCVTLPGRAKAFHLSADSRNTRNTWISSLRKLRSRGSLAPASLNLSSPLLNNDLSVENSAHRMFTKSVEQYCSATNFCEPVRNALLAILLREEIEFTADFEGTEHARLRQEVCHGAIFKPLLRALAGSPFALRDSTLSDINALLMGNPVNCLALRQHESWQMMLLELLVDIPTSCLKGKDDDTLTLAAREARDANDPTVTAALAASRATAASTPTKSATSATPAPLELPPQALSAHGLASPATPKLRRAPDQRSLDTLRLPGLSTNKRRSESGPHSGEDDDDDDRWIEMRQSRAASEFSGMGNLTPSQKRSSASSASGLGHDVDLTLSPTASPRAAPIRRGNFNRHRKRSSLGGDTDASSGSGQSTVVRMRSRKRAGLSRRARLASPPSNSSVRSSPPSNNSRGGTKEREAWWDQPTRSRATTHEAKEALRAVESSQRHIRMWVLNILTLVHYDGFFQLEAPLFGDLLCRTLDSLYLFAGATPESQEVARVLLCALVSKLAGKQHWPPNIDLEDIPWGNLLPLLKLLQIFVFKTSKWGASGSNRKAEQAKLGARVNGTTSESSAGASVDTVADLPSSGSSVSTEPKVLTRSSGMDQVIRTNSHSRQVSASTMPSSPPASLAPPGSKSPRLSSVKSAPRRRLTPRRGSPPLGSHNGVSADSNGESPSAGVGTKSLSAAGGTGGSGKGPRASFKGLMFSFFSAADDPGLHLREPEQTAADLGLVNHILALLRSLKLDTFDPATNPMLSEEETRFLSECQEQYGFWESARDYLSLLPITAKVLGQTSRKNRRSIFFGMGGTNNPRQRRRMSLSMLVSPQAARRQMNGLLAGADQAEETSLADALAEATGKFLTKSANERTVFTTQLRREKDKTVAMAEATKHHQNSVQTGRAQPPRTLPKLSKLDENATSRSDETISGASAAAATMASLRQADKDGEDEPIRRRSLSLVKEALAKEREAGKLVEDDSLDTPHTRDGESAHGSPYHRRREAYRARQAKLAAERGRVSPVLAGSAGFNPSNSFGGLPPLAEGFSRRSKTPRPPAYPRPRHRRSSSLTMEAEQLSRKRTLSGSHQLKALRQSIGRKEEDDAIGVAGNFTRAKTLGAGRRGGGGLGSVAASVDFSGLPVLGHLTSPSTRADEGSPARAASSKRSNSGSFFSVSRRRKSTGTDLPLRQIQEAGTVLDAAVSRRRFSSSESSETVI